MRALAVAAAVVLLSLAAPAAVAQAEAGPGPVALGPLCPLVADFATVCVGGSECLLSVRLMGGDRLCA